MYPKCPANRLSGTHRAKILPRRGSFRCTDPSNHARRADLAIPRCSYFAHCPRLCGVERLFRGFAHMQLRAAPRSRARCSCCRACLRVRRARYPRVRCAYIPRRPTRSKRIRLASLGMSRLAVHAPFALRVRFAVARVVDLVGISYEAGTRISVVASATRPKQRDRVVYRRKHGAVMVFR